MNIMNIFSSIPGLNVAEAYEEQETGPNGGPKGGVKTQGPAKYRILTNGQIRRARKRDLDAMTKKARRKQLRDYHAANYQQAVVRAHLQHAGVLEFSQIAVDPEKQVKSTIWLVQQFGVKNEEGRISILREDVLSALQEALDYWGKIVGIPNPRLPEGYVPAVYAE